MTLRDETLRLWQQLNQLSSKSKPKHLRSGYLSSDLISAPDPDLVRSLLRSWSPGGSAKV
jgi:hypothetical protein